MPDTCPHCKADLRSDYIPAEQRELFGNNAHYSRRISIYDRERDRTVGWRCPDCGGEWSDD